MIPTPHIEAKLEDVAEIVIMPGDPLRAKLIADKYLQDVKQINSVRNMFGYTGKFNGKYITVMGSGMGVASMGIYSYELFKFYNVKTIIRIGTAGGISDNIKLGDIILAQAACTNSNYAHQYRVNGVIAPIADFNWLKKAKDYMDENKIDCKVGNVLTSDTFYSADTDEIIRWKDVGVLGVEMEVAGLYMNAMYLNKSALALCTVSDIPEKNIGMTSDERLNSLHNMIIVALEIATR